jgi:hypothetical protein
MTAEPRTAPEPRTIVKLRSPADILGALPYVLGFHPRESLVVMCLHGPRKRQGLTMRFDLPDVEDETRFVAEVRERTSYQRALAVLLVCFTDAPDADGVLPRQGLVDDLRDALALRGTGLGETLLVRGGRWWSYTCTGPCCPADGTALPAELTAAAGHFAAEVVANGAALLPDREALKASIQPDRGVLVQTVLDHVYDQVGDALVVELAQHGWVAVRTATVVAARAALDRYEQGQSGLANEEAARIVLGLRDKHARDEIATWGAAARRDNAPMLSLLTDLARKAPLPDAAPPCTLLAWVAYMSGNGSLANVAVERALASEPDYTMAQLIADGLEHQVPPSTLRRVSRHAS